MTGVDDGDTERHRGFTEEETDGFAVNLCLTEAAADGSPGFIICMDFANRDRTVAFFRCLLRLRTALLLLPGLCAGRCVFVFDEHAAEEEENSVDTRSCGSVMKEVDCDEVTSRGLFGAVTPAIVRVPTQPVRFTRV